MPAGRPTEYKADYAKQVYKLCLLGATDAEMADIFDVSEQTLNAWKHAHPEFLEAIKTGKKIADAEIANSLYQRAKGYSHPDTDIRVINNEIVKTEIIKYYPPDTAAAFIWLKNRQKEKWRDKQEIEHSGPDGTPIKLENKVVVYIPHNGRDALPQLNNSDNLLETEGDK